MFNKKRSSLILISIMAISILSLGLLQTVAVAQDGEMVVCDSTLITLLYIAEHDYGYTPMTDVSTIDKGQFTPLFDSMMAMMEEMAMTEEPEMAMTEEPEMAMTEEPEMAMTEEAMGTHLESGMVAGEPEVCTALREELEHYLFGHFEEEMMMSEGS